MKLANLVDDGKAFENMKTECQKLSVATVIAVTEKVSEIQQNNC